MKIPLIIYLLAFFLLIGGMNDSSSSSSSDDNLAAAAVGLYFNGKQSYVTECVHTIVREKISDLRSSPGRINKRHIREFDRIYRRLKQRQDDEDIPLEEIITKRKRLRSYVNEMVSESVHEYCLQKESALEEINKIAKRKERHKRIALIIAALSTILSTGVSLIIHYS